MPGVAADIAKHNLFVMVPTGLKMQLRHLNSLVKRVKRPTYVPAKKRITRPIAMGLIRIKQAVNGRLV